MRCTKGEWGREGMGDLRADGEGGEEEGRGTGKVEDWGVKGASGGDRRERVGWVRINGGGMSRDGGVCGDGGGRGGGRMRGSPG